MSYIETAADYAFTFFLAGVVPADLSKSEWALFQYHRLRSVA